MGRFKEVDFAQGRKEVPPERAATNEQVVTLRRRQPARSGMCDRSRPGGRLTSDRRKDQEKDRGFGSRKKKGLGSTRGKVVRDQLKSKAVLMEKGGGL